MAYTTLSTLHHMRVLGESGRVMSVEEGDFPVVASSS